MKNSILADALLNAAKNSEPESAITKLVTSSVGEQLLAERVVKGTTRGWGVHIFRHCFSLARRASVDNE